MYSTVNQNSQYINKDTYSTYHFTGYGMGLIDYVHTVYLNECYCTAVVELDSFQ